MNCKRHKRVALLVLDGWGYAPPGPGNAVELARKPVFDSLWSKYPHALLEASGEAVGLPTGVMGNSEVGHLTLGAGRVIYQDLTRINKAIEDGTFFENPILVGALDKAVAKDKAVHLLGLVSDGEVHSSLGHLHALVKLAKMRGVKKLFIHAFTDGRDTLPTAGLGFIRDLEAFLAQQGLGEIATIAGRYYAMDRDRRWERVKKAYDALVYGKAQEAPHAQAAIEQSYARGETDEFILPTLVSPDAASRISDGDTVIFFNFRPDRARELTAALTQSGFEGFDRGPNPPRVEFVGLTEYDPEFGVAIAFPKQEPRNVLAEVISKAGMTQLHIAETEKYAHVTFFFNGGREEPFPGESRCLVPSPKDVPTYDLKPEMSAYHVVECLARLIQENPVDFVVLNFANPDMVGHTGNLRAAIAAIEHVDKCLGRALQVLAKLEALVIVTADHGNAEHMLEPDGSANTAHTTNPVPLIIVQEGLRVRESAGLADVAPTILAFLGLEVPDEMTGRPLC